jgi:hypothetical protein
MGEETSRLVLPVAMQALVGQLVGPESRRVVVAEHEPAERPLASQQGPRLGLDHGLLDQALLSRAWYRLGPDLEDRVLLDRLGLRHAQRTAPAVERQGMDAAEMRLHGIGPARGRGHCVASRLARQGSHWHVGSSRRPALRRQLLARYRRAFSILGRRSHEPANSISLEK